MRVCLYHMSVPGQSVRSRVHNHAHLCDFSNSLCGTRVPMLSGFALRWSAASTIAQPCCKLHHTSAASNAQTRHTKRPTCPVNPAQHHASCHVPLHISRHTRVMHSSCLCASVTPAAVAACAIALSPRCSPAAATDIPEQHLPASIGASAQLQQVPHSPHTHTRKHPPAHCTCFTARNRS